MIAKLSLSKIRLDGGTQARANINDDVVAEYAEKYAEDAKHKIVEDPMPPVTVYWDKSDYWLVDGFQRVTALKSIGRKQVDALVINGTLRDAILYSVGANASHGLRRTNADKRKAVMTVLENEEWIRWSNLEIARKCKVSEYLVRTLRKTLTSIKCSEGEVTSDQTLSNTVEQQKRTYRTKHGTIATMNTSNIGKRDPDILKFNEGKRRQRAAKKFQSVKLRPEIEVVAKTVVLLSDNEYARQLGEHLIEQAKRDIDDIKREEHERVINSKRQYCRRS